MKKFNYIKWKSQTLPGLLTEQLSAPTCYVCLSGSQESGPANTSMGSYNTGSGYCHISSSNWQIANAPGNLNPNLPSHQWSTNSSYNACTGSAGTGSGCVVNTQAELASSGTAGNPQLGDAGINQNFVNNMQGKPTQFYQARNNAFGAKLQQLRANDYNPNSFGGNGGYEGFCQGSNPHWQSKLVNKMTYVQNCMQNPGSC